ncbi:MAG: prepilin peptidase [Clostridia bacterium]|jgi:leader peptidase (prepilin peptidase)/N-methyltransferase|nr:prepilin peptidase [Clostridia bacterium]
MSARPVLLTLINVSGWLGVYQVYGLTPRGFTGMLLFSVLFYISLVDLKYYLIPNGMVVLFLFLGVIHHFLSGDSPLGSRLLGLAAALALSLLIGLLSRGGLGGGDIKLLGAMGFWAGLPDIFYVFIVSFFLGGLVSLLGLALGRIKRRDAIAFGPYLAVGFMLLFLFPVV